MGEPPPRTAAGQCPAGDRGQDEPHIPPGTAAAAGAPKPAPTGGRLGAALNGRVCCLCCCCMSCSGFAYTASVFEGYISLARHPYCLQAGWRFGFHPKQISSLSREENSLPGVRAGHAEAPPLLAVWQSLAVGAAKPRGRTAARRHTDVAQKSIVKNSALFLHWIVSPVKLFFPGTLGEARGSDKAAS